MSADTSTSCDAGPSSTEPQPKVDCLTLFIRHPHPKMGLRCVHPRADTSVRAFWHFYVAPILGGHPPDGAFRLMCSGRTLPLTDGVSLAAAGVPPLATLEVTGRLPSEGFARLHQMMEHLLEALAPAPAPATKPPPATDDFSGMAAREPIMHAIDAQARAESNRVDARADARAVWSSCGRVSAPAARPH